MAQTSDGTTKNIVLVHGGFVDGWEGVYQILKGDGCGNGSWGFAALHPRLYAVARSRGR
jgi:hypothetical protein